MYLVNRPIRTPKAVLRGTANQVHDGPEYLKVRGCDIRGQLPFPLVLF